MAFLVEDGTGLVGANSFASVEFADIYHAERGNTTWATFSENRKQQLLISASDYIKNIYRNSFIGYQYSAAQGLPWPRSSYPGYGGYLYSLGVPQDIAEATVELALVASTSPLIPTTATQTKKMIKVGSITIEYDNSVPTVSRFLASTMRLGHWLSKSASNTNMARLIRV